MQFLNYHPVAMDFGLRVLPVTNGRIYGRAWSFAGLSVFANCRICSSFVLPCIHFLFGCTVAKAGFRHRVNTQCCAAIRSSRRLFVLEDFLCWHVCLVDKHFFAYGTSIDCTL